MKIILATWNDQKFKWLSEGFSNTNLPIASVNKREYDDVEETGTDCAENALIKVHAIGPKPNCFIIGEDSGLFIDALNGFPGVKTVRWMEGTDDDRSIKILERMKGIPENRRTARFVSSIALLLPDGTEKIFTGTLEGKIAEKLSAEPGKGYRQIFVLQNGRSIAESGSSLVMENDHRFQAMKKAVKYIKQIL